MGWMDDRMRGELICVRGSLAGRTYAVPLGAASVVGRSQKAELHMPDASVSRLHCRFEPGEYGLRLVDLGSTNGTYVNGSPTAGLPLLDGDKILCGNLEFVFRFVMGHAAPPPCDDSVDTELVLRPPAESSGSFSAADEKRGR